MTHFYSSPKVSKRNILEIFIYAKLPQNGGIPVNKRGGSLEGHDILLSKGENRATNGEKMSVFLTEVQKRVSAVSSADSHF